MSKISRNLGIISICICCLAPAIGVLLGIIGLAIKKENYNRDVTLNTIGLALSIFVWLIYISF